MCSKLLLQEMYNAANAGGQTGADANQGASNPNDEVTDVDFEEVQ